MQKIFIGADHGGFELKEIVKKFLVQKKYEVEDLGCFSSESCDYPIFGAAVGNAVREHKNSLGIVICGSGIGISIAANKIKGIRCVLANSNELAQLGREHNGANILALGGRTKFIDAPLEIVETFLHTELDRSERHERRRNCLNGME